LAKNFENVEVPKGKFADEFLPRYVVQKIGKRFVMQHQLTDFEHNFDEDEADQITWKNWKSVKNVQRYKHKKVISKEGSLKSIIKNQLGRYFFLSKVSKLEKRCDLLPWL
jgi:hypothetical protein